MYEGPLKGIRVLEAGRWVAVPWAGRVLASLGAEVIKIEPLAGDPMRGLTTLHGERVDLKDGHNLLFETVNANKKSVCVNYNLPEGREVIYRLVKKADAFIHNWREEAVREARMDAETLRSHNPSLIYAHLTAYGDKGPYKDLPAFDPAIQGRSGIMDSAGEPGLPPPYIRGGISDNMGGLMISFAVVTALLARERLGIPQQVTTSLFASMLELQSSMTVPELYLHSNLKRRRTEAYNPLWNHYPCKDGWVILTVLRSDNYWERFCEAVDMKRLVDDPRFENAEKRAENRQALVSILDETFVTRTKSEWLEIFTQKDIPGGVVGSIIDLPDDSQVVANELIVDRNNPYYGTLKVPAFAIKFERTEAQVSVTAPELGQNTEEVLIDYCGYTWDAITKLKEKSIIP